MSLFINIGIGLLILGYVGFTVWKNFKKQQSGKCAGCVLNKHCTVKSCDSIVEKHEIPPYN
ncbi:FeoB-associated Cys-rich membrane protein [Bacillus testis]|uniref:FeoB-associated Cys-rich membrane protein n=1 Tax=Bacillus testis TaxID=1622072 RepID=UPI00067F11C3|nr:FeoB-associated Cys-rich membrane protein [Bacillus testis]